GLKSSVTRCWQSELPSTSILHTGSISRYSSGRSSQPTFSLSIQRTWNMAWASLAAAGKLSRKSICGVRQEAGSEPPLSHCECEDRPCEYWLQFLSRTYSGLPQSGQVSLMPGLRDSKRRRSSRPAESASETHRSLAPVVHGWRTPSPIHSGQTCYSDPHPPFVSECQDGSLPFPTF